MGNLSAALTIVSGVSHWQRLGVGIGQRIRELREAQGVGLRELAGQVKSPTKDGTLLPLTPGALSKIENEETKQPAFETVAAIADALGVTLDDLRKGGDAPLTHTMLSEYVRSRFRAWRREGMRLADIGRRCAMEASLVRKTWGGGRISDVVVAGLLHGFRLETPEELVVSAREWWRTAGRDLVIASKSIDDPVPARAEANADATGFGVTHDDILSAIETNPNRETETVEFWLKAFLKAKKDRLEAEAADQAQLDALKAARGRKDAATDEAAQKIARARAERAAAETPPPQSAGSKTAPKSVRGRRAKLG